MDGLGVGLFGLCFEDEDDWLGGSMGFEVGVVDDGGNEGRENKGESEVLVMHKGDVDVVVGMGSG